MYLLYLDESGNPDEPADRYFVVAGAAIFERQTFFRAAELDAIKARYFPQKQPIEFHAQHMLSGKGFWRNVPVPVRQAVLQDVGKVIAHRDLVLFAAAVEKDSETYGETAVRVATEQVCSRFDMYLKRRFRRTGEAQRGLLIFDESRFEQRNKIWVQGFRDIGTQWGGVVANLADIPFFASSRETRLLQVADYVAHGVFRLFEHGQPDLIRPVIYGFDKDRGKIHGLVHVSSNRESCECPACFSRRVPNQLGPWFADPDEKAPI